ncbi:DMT family transporter [Amnibacterium setariae]|uniref:Multidrug DMT transporter permease n=1 Tax=Amnibacterium setariae TaxID=2306585 RepID=A0A3A1TU61_9MICO|nr:DMT family transporter [Amnibacterium setariae]RIX27752.1 multidrug DMT transporter permease [Amnibacterium setariae]
MIGGVVAALLGAVFLALGAQFQGRGVRSVDRAEHRDGLRQALRLFGSGGWLLGTGFLVLAILLQLVGLLLAPLPVVQPIGVLSLVVTALLERRLAHARIGRRGVTGVVVAIVGTAAFVVVAALTTRSSSPAPAVVIPVLVLVGVVLLVLLGGWVALRTRAPAVAFAVAGAACFGFVVTLMKVVLDRSAAAVQQGALIGPSTPFSLLVLVAAGIAGAAGLALVQRAYASGSADIVVAALTVVDPLVAVTLGIALLDQARGAPVWAFPAFALAVAVAIAGVVLLARNPPVPVDRQEARGR